MVCTQESHNGVEAQKKRAAPEVLRDLQPCILQGEGLFDQQRNGYYQKEEYGHCERDVGKQVGALEKLVGSPG